MTGAFICPVCGNALNREDRGLCCKNGHSFDLAKEGYVNLLLVSRMRTKMPGDSKEMVAARHRFLNNDGYKPFAEELARLCAEQAKKKNGPLHILDAGCGEGYYDAVIAHVLQEQGVAFELVGFDISKAAVRLAAKRQIPNARYAVASSFCIPVADGWADVILNVFSPFAGEEFRRCLCRKGRLVYAVPTARHLMGLKEVLYDVPYENSDAEVSYEGFVQAAQTQVEAQLAVRGQQVQDLFSMTPYYWKTSAEGSARLAQCDELQTPIGFRFVLYDKI